MLRTVDECQVAFSPSRTGAFNRYASRKDSTSVEATCLRQCCTVASTPPWPWALTLDSGSFTRAAGTVQDALQAPRSVRREGLPQNCHEH
ncbi:uncharacterized protein SETTUDRAFT_161110 [Exserohilum turcica Et28A]|uniref:Uncharacterized protein n=1 Tax=Exserohilum turcicum (strain 28A) TaxID=671987 RepID=R0KHR0_EXST2|nr:uncharacterized protein SETTUDRAFT_161110 [Exserohilum turcica Et28A]EOA87572.1 hypothetical protein SETTUDRAFT_161110 [Exserohilum turcica Et28A]